MLLVWHCFPSELADCTSGDEIGADKFLEYMEKLLTPPPPPVSLLLCSFSRTVGCMLLTSIDGNENVSSVLEMDICLYFNETFLWHLVNLTPDHNLANVRFPFNNFLMLPFSFQTFLLGCNSEGLKE